MQIFKTKGKGEKPYISEKSIIRPTFSYLGNFTISDSVFRQIAEYQAAKIDGINKVLKFRIETEREEPVIYVDLSLVYGYNILESIKKFKEKVIKEIRKSNIYECCKY